MAQDKFDVLIFMEQAIFSKNKDINEIITKLASAITIRFQDRGISAERVGQSQKIRIKCKRIENNQDVAAFVDSLDFVLSLVKVIL